MKKEKINTPSATENKEIQIVQSHMAQDVKNSVLIVSLVANLFVLTAWIAVQVTSRYDAQVASFLFN